MPHAYPPRKVGVTARHQVIKMMNFILISQASMGALLFVTLFVQILVLGHVDLKKWHRATWVCLIVQAVIALLFAVTVVAFGLEADLSTVLMLIGNAAWLCLINLLMTLAIPACHMKR